MTKPFAVFDIDGTIFRSSLLIEILEALIQKGIFSSDVAVDIDKLKLDWLNRESEESYKNYIEKTVAVYISNIKGVSENQLRLISEPVIENKHRQTYIFTRNLINQIKDSHILLAISGSPSTVVELFCKKYGFKDYIASTYGVTDGVFNGQAVGASKDKDGLLSGLIKKHSLDLKGSIAIGDSIGDSGLLKMVEEPIAFNPDSKLRALAIEQGWKIVVERKSEIYELEKHGEHYTLA